MPESVTKTPTSPVKSPSKNDKIKEAEGKMNNDTDSPKRRTLGRTARAKVELLDGSIMDLDVERKIRGHELLERVCDSLNLVEKDYFGLLFEDRGDPRAWIELEKRVSKQIKNEPWKVEFAVKFYPPEPGQLQEELTRYQLVLAIRKDIIESRLPCSSVTHALLASYLLQSELGDYEPSEHGAGNCKKLGLIPAEECTPEIEEKVVELHKTHRSQTPAEAELNYLENAKKLAMYGVDLHHARDSEGVDIMLGVCSSGLLVYREKLRINRFAWPKILKISYKRHNFFVKLRPGEFEEYESTVGFKLANHRAAKKLWKTCVEHHTFFRLMSPEPSNRSTLFPRLGSKFRYSGRTHYESKRAPVTRPAPHFNRTLSNRKLSSRSMDGLAQKADTLPADATKRHTMPPQPASRPSTAAKKPPPGAVKVMPVPEKQNKETSPKPNENGRDTTNGEAIDTTPKKSKAGGFGLFGKREKSPKESPDKEKSPKEKKSPVKDKKSPSKEKVAVLDTSLEKSADKSPTKSDKSADKPGYTKPYNYTEAEQKSPTRKPFIQGAFSYEKEPVAGAKQSSPEDSQSPTYRKATGLAFNYAPGEDKKVVESAEKRRTADSNDPRLKTPGIDYVQSAALKEQAKAGKDDLSAALIEAEKRQAEAFVPSVIPVAAGKPAGKEIKVVTITSKYNPKNKKLDDANGVVSVVKGIVDPQNGKITTDTELIDPKAGDVQYTNPSTNKKELKTGAVDAKNNTILFTTDVSDPKTGRLDPALGQQYHFCDKYSDAVGAIQGKEVDIVSVIGKYDNKHKKLDPAHIEVSRGVVDKTGKIHTSYGVIDPVSGKIVHTDPKTNKQEIKQAYVDHKTGNYLVTAGVVDPKSGKIDSSLGQQISVVEKDAKKANREVRLVVVTGKVDPKTKKLDIAHAYVDSVSAVLNGNDGKIYSEYGVIDPRSGNIVYTDKNTGKQDVKIAVVDHKTGNLILESGVVDPRTGNSDPSLLQQYSIVDKPTDSFAHVPGREVQLVVITHKYDGKTKKLENANGHIETSRGILSGEDGKIHTNFGIIDTSTGKIKYTDPKSGKVESKTGHVDPVTGHLLVTSGVIDPRTGKTDSSLGQQWCIVDKIASKPVERHLNLVVITTKYEPKSKKLDGANAIVDTVPASIGADGKIHTKYGNIDLETGDISGVDPVTGKEVVKRGQVDHKTGNILLNNGVVDPRTGQIDNTLGQLYTIVARPSDRFGAVKGKEVEVVSVISKVDGKNKKLEHPNGHVEVSRGVVDNDGKVHTNFGVIDPKTGKIQNADAKTGKIETKQANVDPKNGSLLLTSGVVDPKSGKPDSSLGQQFTVVDKDAPKIDRYVRLIIITTKYDPKTKKLDATQAQIDTISGSVASDGKLHTSVGIIDPKTGDIAVTDPKTGKQELKKTHFDPHTGNFVVTSHVVDPKTGKEDPNLAIQYSIVDKSVPRSKPQLAALGEVQLVVITGKLDPKTKQLDSSAANVDSFKGYVSGEDGKVHTDNYILDPKSGQILYKDPFTGKQELKQAQKDPKSGNYSVSGILDPKTGKVDNSIVQQFTIVDKSNLIAKTITPLSSPKAPSPSPAITQTPLSRSAPPPPVIVSSPKPPVIPSKTPPPTPVVETTPLVTSMQKSLIPATSEAPKKRLVKIMIIFTKLDPKTKKPDLPNAEVEHITGILDPSNGQIETKYGTLDSTKGNMIITDPATGQKQTKDGVVIKETNQVFINTGAIDPKTGKIDPNLGMLVSVARQEDPVIEITTITGPVDVHGQVKVREGVVEHTKGKVDAETGHISTKYGVIDPSNGVIFVSEVSGVQDTKPIKINENTGHVTIVGVADPKTGKVDPNLGQVIVVGSHIDPVVEVTTFLGKIDSKKGIIEPKNSVIESSTGQLNPENNIIDTKYGQIDLVKGTVTYNDPKTGKFESKEVKVDPVTGQILLKSGQINPKSGKPDKDIGRQISLRITQNKIDPVSGKQIVENDPKNIKIDPKTNQMWTAGPKDPVSGEIIYTTGQIDPKTGYIVTIYGKIDPKTGNIVRTTEIDKSLIKVDPVNGQIYTATGQSDANNQPLYSASQVDSSTGEIYTKLGRIDPKTGRLVIVRIFVVTQKDDKGRVKEVDPKDCTIDESTGRIVTTKTVYVYQIVDPITGETIEVDPDDPRLKGARTTVTQTMTLSGKIDPVTGRIKTEYGDIDPDTGDIDPSTAVRDPVTGQLLLHYSQIDPSHFNDKSSNYTIEKETQDLPASIDIERINRTKHSTFDKNSEEPKTFTEYTTSEHIMHHGYVSSVSPTSKIPVSQRKGSKSPSTPPPPATQAPVVVKTTTKQVLTKNEDGVTHNVEEEVENLQTGEVTFSTQTNKADLEESTTGKSPYVSARAVTTRTATTHEDLGTNAKTQQLEEKTVAHTLTSSAHRHEQRVVTQEVKTTSTVTTGDQRVRHDSESSFSSGDSGTPIDLDDAQEPGHYTSTKTSTLTGTVPTGSMSKSDKERSVEGHPDGSETLTEGEIVSSQTISSKTRTVETITYKTEKDGVVETRVEQKITIQSDGDPIDHDRALAEAIKEATEMNPDMMIEKIEIQQQSAQQQ